MKNKKYAWINAIFLAFTLIVNTLGAIGAINGLSQKQISDMFPTLITPNPPTFSIWSIIYSLLITSVIMMIIFKKDFYYQRALNQLSFLFPLSCLLNIAWIVSFSYVQIELSVLFIFVLVITLSLICKKLLQIQEGSYWLLPLTFGLYTGWLFIATVVNISVALINLEWNGFGITNETWTTIILILSVLLVIGVQSNNKNAVFALPVAWAYWGIYRSLGISEVFIGQYDFLQLTALAGMFILISSAAIQFYRNHFSLLPSLDN